MDLQLLEHKSTLAAAMLKALANEKRLMIVCVLSKGEKNVGELEKIIELSQSALSQHLARLRRDGILVTRRDAQTIYYAIKDKAVLTLLDCLCCIYSEQPCH